MSSLLASALPILFAASEGGDGHAEKVFSDGGVLAEWAWLIPVVPMVAAFAIVLFGKLQVTTANLLQVSPSLLASGMAVGSAMGSISSPLKIALAASMCGAEGREGWILARTIPLGIGAALALGFVLLIVV